MSKAPFPIDPHLTAIAIGYRNLSLIADSVLPRVPVGKAEFKWWKFDLGQGFTVPTTTVGRTSQPNQIEFDAESKEVFNAANYPVGNKENLAAADQWDNDASKPIRKIVTALDKMIMRPNVAVLGRSTATALRQNPSVVKAYNGTLGEDGLVPLDFLRGLLELDEIVVGSAFVNIARPGQKPVLVRAWANHAAFIYRNLLADTQGGVTFGFTAQFGSRVSGSIPDPDMGMRGGQRVRVGESVREL
ncbi:MAG: phage capsid protein, partial [Klebsiella oxytoca]|nr:phage capsid protein [Klebsiella oxytoca]